MLAVAVLSVGCAGSDSGSRATAPIDPVVRAMVERKLLSQQTFERQVMGSDAFGTDQAAREAWWAQNGEPRMLTEDEATCWATTLVEEYGDARFADVDAGPTEAEVIRSFAFTCQDHWKQVFFKFQTEGTNEISDASLNCMAAAVTDDEAKQMAMTLLEFKPGPDLDAVFALYARCLTSAERGRLDWN